MSLNGGSLEVRRQTIRIDGSKNHMVAVARRIHNITRDVI